MEIPEAEEEEEDKQQVNLKNHDLHMMRMMICWWPSNPNLLDDDIRFSFQPTNNSPPIHLTSTTAPSRRHRVSQLTESLPQHSFAWWIVAYV